MEVPVHIVHAFTAGEEGGNPAGVVLGAESWPAEAMQAIATRLALSETVFVDNSGEEAARLRFFTPTQEVDLCGHGSIAAWSVLRDTEQLSPGQYQQVTKAGMLEIEIAQRGLVFMQQAEPEYLGYVSPEEAAAALGLSPADLHPRLTPQIISTGLEDLFVPVKDEAVLAGIQPDFPAIEQLSQAYGVEGVHVSALLNPYDRDSMAVARMFAPLFGIPEEAATGTAAGALLCYLRTAEELPHSGPYRIEQGEGLGQLSHLYGLFRGTRIWVGGLTKLIKREVVTV